MIAAMPMRSIVGDAGEVHRRILDMAEQSTADEVMVTTFLPERADRQRMVLKLADAFGLPEQPSMEDATASAGSSRSYQE